MAAGRTTIEQDIPAKVQDPSAPRPKALVEFEEYVGIPLERTEKAHPECPLWHWSWSPTQARYFLGTWQNTMPMLIPIIRELAMTPAPSYTTDRQWVPSNQLLYEVACKAEVRASIDQAEDDTGPTGGKTPYPHGNILVDLICRVPGFRSDIYTINDHRFWGRVSVDEATAKQLRYMHGNAEAEKLRVMQGSEREINLGGLR